jgi:hypothetical protein
MVGTLQQPASSQKPAMSGQIWPAPAPRQRALVNARLRPLGLRPVGPQPAGSEQILVEDTIDLDGRRGMAAQKATGIRRQLATVDAAHAALRMRQEELDILLAAPATGWGEAVAKARYLLILFAQTPAAEDPRRATLIADVFADFERLLAESRLSANPILHHITPRIVTNT